MAKSESMAWWISGGLREWRMSGRMIVPSLCQVVQASGPAKRWKMCWGLNWKCGVEIGGSERRPGSLHRIQGRFRVD